MTTDANLRRAERRRLEPPEPTTCRHESCRVIDREQLEPDVISVHAACDDCPAILAWDQTPGRGDERLNLEVIDYQQGAA